MGIQNTYSGLSITGISRNGGPPRKFSDIVGGDGYVCPLPTNTLTIHFATTCSLIVASLGNGASSHLEIQEPQPSKYVFNWDVELAASGIKFKDDAPAVLRISRRPYEDVALWRYSLNIFKGSIILRLDSSRAASRWNDPIRLRRKQVQHTVHYG